MRKITTSIILIIVTGYLPAMGIAEPESTMVATTSWTAAFVQAAGYSDDIHILADTESCAMDRFGTGDIIIDDHISRHMFPLVNGFPH